MLFYSFIGFGNGIYDDTQLFPGLNDYKTGRLISLAYNRYVFG